jgi:hypothetical protein
MKSSIQIIMLALLLTSCASRLKVDIQIADRKEILKAANDESYKTKEFNPLQLIQGIDKFTDKWKSEKKLESILSFLYENFSTGEVSINTKDSFVKGLNAKVDTIKKRVENSRYAFMIDNNVDESKKQLKVALEKLYTLDYAFRNDYKIKGGIEICDLKYEDILKRPRGNEIDKSNFENLKRLSCITKELVVEASTALGTTRERFPILGDPLASYIAMDDNKFIWKSVFNKTVAWSFLGNSDIAMILRSNPPARELKSGDYNNNFTIKGVRMDASDVSNAIINGLTQTVNFIANTQGLPTNFGTNPASTSSPIPTENPAITSMQVDKDKLEIKKRKLIEYKQLLLKKIELENIVVDKDSGTDVKAKAKRIKDYWDGLKTELNKP